MRGRQPTTAGEEVWQVGRATWPSITLRREELFEYLRDLARKKGAAPAEALERADVYLVCACLRGNPEAIAAFEKTQMKPLREVLSRHVALDAALLDDLLQRMRADLFARGDRPSKLSSYSGRGKVRAWLTTMAIRAARELRPSDSRVPRTLSSALAVYARTPEIEALEAAHRKDFRAAFSDAMTKLSVRERNLLRLHFLDGLSIDRIGALYDVHRATAARWVSAAREKLTAETRRQVSRRLGLPANEVDDLMQLLHSQLDLSISRHLRGEPS
jgi:RNA polymerase sigma-70 factor, ECF subfamily